MKNKFRRSMTSVLLAASLLFSSQSVVAFADYGSKSDTSDLSPVQESVETVVKDEQTTVSPEEPAKNGEEGEQEKTETPEKPAEGEGEEQDKPETETPKTPADPSAVALAALETANTDADFYDISGLPANHYFTYSSGDEGIDSVYCSDKNETFSGFITIGDKICTQTGTVVWEDDYENVTTFTVTTKLGYELFHLYGDNVTENDFTPLGNNKYKFRFTDNGAEDLLDKNVSFSLETAKIQYKFIDEEGNSLGTATIGERISLPQPEEKPGYEFIGWYVGETKLGDTLTEDIIAFADENNQIKVEAKYEDNKPFWTFNADKNGSVKWNDGESKDSIVFTKSEVEKLKGNDAIEDFIYAVPDENYGFAGWETSAYFDGTANVCLENMNSEDPITATATFNPLVNIKFDAGEHGELVNPDEANGQITSNQEVSFDDTYRHHFLSFPEINVKEGYRLIGWTSNRKDVEDGKLENGSVSRPVEYVEEGITYTAQYEKVPAEKIEHIEINLGENLKKELKVDPLYLHAEYDGKYIFLTGRNGYFTTPTGIEDLPSWVIDLFKGGPIPESLTTDINDATKAKEFFNGFTFIEWNLVRKQNISFEYIYDVKVDGTTLYITLETPTTEVPEVKPDSFDNIPVAFVCENEKIQHEEGTVLKTISLKESGLSYTYDENEVETGALTLHFDENPIEDYLSLVGKYTSGHVYTYDDSSIDLQYDEVTKTWYAPSETEGQQDSYKIYVTCDEDIPDKPTVEDIRDELKVVLDCITEQNHHDSKTYALLETDAFEIVGPYVAPMPLSYEGDMTTPHYFAQVRVKTNSLLEDYNTDHTAHTYAANNPDAIFVLAGNPAPRSTEYMWDLLGEDTIVLNVQHTNPTDPTDPTDPGTNPGGNGGDNDDDDDRYTGDNTVTRTINDDDVPLNDRPTNTTTIDDEDVPLADLPDDTVTIDDGEVPLKANPSTGDSLPFAAMAAAVLSLGGVIVLNRKKK